MTTGAATTRSLSVIAEKSPLVGTYIEDANNNKKAPRHCMTSTAHVIWWIHSLYAISVACVCIAKVVNPDDGNVSELTVLILVSVSLFTATLITVWFIVNCSCLAMRSKPDAYTKPQPKDSASPWTPQKFTVWIHIMLWGLALASLVLFIAAYQLTNSTDLLYGSTKARVNTTSLMFTIAVGFFNFMLLIDIIADWSAMCCRKS